MPRSHRAGLMALLAVVDAAESALTALLVVLEPDDDACACTGCRALANIAQRYLTAHDLKRVVGQLKMLVSAVKADLDPRRN